MKRLNIQTHPELASMTCKSRKLRATNHAMERARSKGIQGLQLNSLRFSPICPF
jgi:hypothetical protein